MKKLISAFVFLSLLIVGTAQAQTALISSDGVSQITLPAGWTQAAKGSLNAQAEIEMSNVAGQMYLISLTEDRTNAQNITLEAFSEGTRGFITKGLTNPVQTGPTKLIVDGNPAIQYKITGTMNNIDIAYLHTVIQTPKNFHQLLAWTSTAQYDNNKPTMDSVIFSFKEIKK